MIVDSKVNNYIKNLIPKRNEYIQSLEQYAHEQKIPIMDIVSSEIMLQLLQFIQPKNILEIGTAIGYSAIRMATAIPAAQVVTIERDETRYKEALANIESQQLQSRIHVICGDALECYDEVAARGPFDCIFIDAAKGQYERFFTMYEKQLTKAGVIISDNVLFKGMVAQAEIENKRLKGMVRKLQAYNEWLMNHPNYQTTIYPVGDGIAVSKKR